MNYEQAYKELSNLISSQSGGLFDVLNEFIDTVDKDIKQTLEASKTQAEATQEPVKEVDAFQEALNKIR